MVSVEDRRSVRLVCKAWSTAARETLTELCPDSYARPSRITRARYPSLESVDLTMLRGWGRAGEEYWVPALVQLDLKHLTLGHSNGMRAQVLRQICRMPNLQSLHLSRKQLLPGSHAELANLPQSLRALSLTWVNGTSPQSSGDLTSLELGALWHGMLEAVAAVLSLPQLERLELRGCAGLDGGALRGLAGMPALRALRLSSCGQLDAAALAALGSAPALRDLALVNCRLEGMGGLAPLRGLRRLDLGGSTCAEEAGVPGLEALLAALPALAHLELACRGGELGALARVAGAGGLPALRTLRLAEVHGGDAGKELAALARFPALAALGVSLEGGEALVARLAALAPLPLTALRLAHVPALDAAALRALRSLRSLRSLALHAAALPDGWAPLALAAALPALERLDLSHLTCPGTAMDARHAHDGACLARLVSLRCVGCSTALHRALAAGLHTAPSLEQASLAHGWTSDADVAPLAALPALRRLALTGTGRGASLSAGGLRALVGGSRSLARLVVDAGWDQDEGLSAALDAAPRVLCQVCEGEVRLDEALSATNLGRLEPFNPCRPAAE